MSTLRGDIRGPPMPPPPPPPPMPPRAPGAHYPYYHDGAPGKAAHGAPHHRHHPPYDGMMHPYHPPPYPYPYGQHQQQQPFYPAAPRLSLGGDRSSTATFGSGHGDYRRTSSHGAPIDPYGAYSTELYPPPQSRRPADSMDRQDSRDRHDPSGGDSGQERNGGRKSMRIRRKESRS
ncbi:hypothetical protein SYNPS1DRAFT_32145 [Syncephalis pseudoplumigaleata]|uniref:Uncharacterized protein n=1 Tax=Syncephalis pseudoplumigaleata TaxID=1712513 RepID=A0A4P9YRK8_9FUNG|nr:hypothetical protein SYNPS1DRAFT_32145 [Syncephalis pseudoplumigaleata]|eukprot:RKP22278.1 hypothetical protein SYNPS1DRAFT_32145 [Syncephalis pseudoplumigaleata]